MTLRLTATILPAALGLLLAPSLHSQDDQSRKILPVFGLSILNTSIAALDAGLTYRHFGPRKPFLAPVASVEGGVAGGQVSIGLGYYRPPTADWGGPGSELSVRLQATALRTWGDPFHVGPRQSFVGLELQGMLTIVGIRLGYYQRVHKPATGGDSFVSAGLILGWQ